MRLKPLHIIRYVDAAHQVVRLVDEMTLAVALGPRLDHSPISFLSALISRSIRFSRVSGVACSVGAHK
jgi:hypothetical protein